jgi:hypothetical protein
MAGFGFGRFGDPDVKGVFIREAQLFILPLSEAQGGGPVDQAVVINSKGRKDDLRIDFRIRKNLVATGMPNSIEVSVYNLSHATRQLLSKSATNIEFQVGYQEGNVKLQTVAKGGIASVVTVREGADYRTTIFCYDGLDGLAQAVSQKAFVGNTILNNIVQELAKDIAGVEVSEVDIKIDSGIVVGTKGRVFSGATPSILDKLAREFGFNWFIQNGVFKALQDGFVGGQTYRIGSDTGNLLSATPTVDNINQVVSGIDIQTVLDPRINAGDSVTLVSKINDFINGTYQTTFVTHIGDTHGQVWQTNIQCLFNQEFRNLLRTSANTSTEIAS